MTCKMDLFVLLFVSRCPASDIPHFSNLMTFKSHEVRLIMGFQPLIDGLSMLQLESEPAKSSTHIVFKWVTDFIQIKTGLREEQEDRQHEKIGETVVKWRLSGSANTERPSVWGPADPARSTSSRISPCDAGTVRPNWLVHTKYHLYGKPATVELFLATCSYRH